MPPEKQPVFRPIPTEIARHLQAGGDDAYGNVPERAISDGKGVPCRHCLKQIPKQAPYLIVAYRPFSDLQPYAETGPIFLCANACDAPMAESKLPEILESPTYILRGYSSSERIIYGTGGVVPTGDLTNRAADLLENPNIAFVDVRSASNNCFQVRIERGSNGE